MATFKIAKLNKLGAETSSSTTEVKDKRAVFDEIHERMKTDDK